MMTLLFIVELVDVMPFCFAASEGVSMNLSASSIFLLYRVT